MGWRGGAVIGSKEAVEKVSSRNRSFNKYHSFPAVLITASDELGAQAREGDPETKHGSGGVLGRDQIDSCGDTIPPLQRGA